MSADSPVSGIPNDGFLVTLNYGPLTPPTQWITGAQKGMVSHGDSVADYDAFGPDEDFFDHAA
jgi:hypothetical protein